MEKINFELFKNECKKLNGKNICIKIERIVETKKEIKNAQIIVNSNRIFISNEENDEINIDVNYISNFYKGENMLRCELDNLFEIYIFEERI